jgi:arylesterase / paraoxonase
MPETFHQADVSQTASEQPSRTGYALKGLQSLVALRAERCIAIDLTGPEDVAIDHKHGIAYISSQARKRPLANERAAGAIYMLDLKSDNLNAKNVTAVLAPQLRSFHPLGIDLFIDASERARLLVVNHANGGCRIEVFAVADREQGVLEHVCSVGPHAFLTFPNGIAACAQDEFYVTNPRKLMDPEAFVDDMLHLRSGRILHCHFSDAGDATWTIADEGLSYPNGIAIEKQGGQPRVYVALVMAKQILVYTRTSEGRLAKCKTAIDLPAAPDNLSLDTSGDLWVGANPSLIKALPYFAGWRETSPSAVLRVSHLRDTTPIVETVFSDDGGLLSGSSVGCHYATSTCQKLIVGAVVQDRLLVVDLD